MPITVKYHKYDCPENKFSHDGWYIDFIDDNGKFMWGLKYAHLCGFWNYQDFLNALIDYCGCGHKTNGTIFFPTKEICEIAAKRADDLKISQEVFKALGV